MIFSSQDSRTEGDGELSFLVSCRYQLILQKWQYSAIEVCLWAFMCVSPFFFITTAGVADYGLLSD